jgi:hypothetical protein
MRKLFLSASVVLILLRTSPAQSVQPPPAPSDLVLELQKYCEEQLLIRLEEQHAVLAGLP